MLLIENVFFNYHLISWVLVCILVAFKPVISHYKALVNALFYFYFNYQAIN